MTEDGSAGTSTSGKEGDVRHPFCYRGSCLSCVTDTRLSAQSLRPQKVQPCPRSRPEALTHKTKRSAPTAVGHQSQIPASKIRVRVLRHRWQLAELVYRGQSRGGMGRPLVAECPTGSIAQAR